MLHWDSNQYVVQLGVSGALTLGVVDTGSCRTLMDENLARELGLTVTRSRGREFGTYRTPGGDDVKSYVGIVKGPVLFNLGKGVAFTVENLRVLNHPVPLLLLGADLLRGGRSAGVNFDGISQKTVGPGHVVGKLCFTVVQGGQEVSCPLLYCPAEEGRKFVAAGGQVERSLVGQVIHLDDGTAPIGGQCVQCYP